MPANKWMEKSYVSVLKLFPQNYRKKYAEEMREVFSREIEDANWSLIFFVRTILNLLWAAVVQQKHALLGVAILGLGLIVTYNQLQFAWDERSLQTGVVTGIALLLTSIGLLRQKTWTIYPWSMAVLVIIDLVLQSTYWQLAPLWEPYCINTVGTVACMATPPVVDVWYVLSIVSVAIPAYGTYLITKLILSERKSIVESKS